MGGMKVYLRNRGIGKNNIYHEWTERSRNERHNSDLLL